jgi:hypothetical protein
MTNFLDTKTNTDLAKGIIGCVQAAMFVDGSANAFALWRLVVWLSK